MQAQTYIKSKQQQSPRKPLPLTQVCTDFPLIYSSLDGFTALLCLEMLMTSSSRYLQMCWQGEFMEVRIHQDYLGFSFLMHLFIYHYHPLSSMIYLEDPRRPIRFFHVWRCQGPPGPKLQSAVHAFIAQQEIPRAPTEADWK